MHRTLVAPLAGAVLALAAGTASAAENQIVPGRSIGGFSLLGTHASASAVFGAGRAQAVTQPSDLPPLSYVRYPHARVRVGFTDPGPSGRASYMETWSPGYRTATGIHVGSTKAALRAAYPRVRCVTSRLCVLGRQTPGQRVTLFRFRNGAVGLIGLGFVQD